MPHPAALAYIDHVVLRGYINQLPSGRLKRNGPNSQAGNIAMKDKDKQSHVAQASRPADSTRMTPMNFSSWIQTMQGTGQASEPYTELCIIQSHRISWNARGYCSEVQNASNASVSVQ